jgi:hypothetical protein
MAGYTKVYAEVNGNVVDVDDFNTEFQSLADTFVLATGHKHDGTSAEGAYVPTISDTANRNVVVVNTTDDTIDFYTDVASVKTRQVRLWDGKFEPEVDDDIDLGSATKEFKDLYLDGVANIDSLVADTADINAGTIDGTDIGVSVRGAGNFTTLDANGSVTLGSDGSDTITFNGDTAGHITPNVDNTDDIGSTSFQYKDLYINGVGYIDTIDNPSITGAITEEVYNLTGTAIDASNGTIQQKTLSGNTTLTDSLNTGESIILMIDDGTAYTITWPTMQWIGGVAPTLATTGYTTVVLWKDGSTLYGSNAGDLS